MFDLINLVRIYSLIKSFKLFLPSTTFLKFLGLTLQDSLWFLILQNGGESRSLLVMYDKP